MDVKIEPSWKKELTDEFMKPYFETLIQFVKSEYAAHPTSIFPKGNQIFKAFDGQYGMEKALITNGFYTVVIDSSEFKKFEAHGD